MSKLNIRRLIGNITHKSNVYTPIIEAIVNAVQSIEDAKRSDNGEIIVTVKRSSQSEMSFDENNGLPEIESVQIEDNGLGFNQKNRDSFDTLYSASKEDRGGKGFGRFMFLKYFQSVSIESHFCNEEDLFVFRKFNLGQDSEIIENETISDSTEKEAKTTVYLKNLKDKKLEKQLSTIARKILEKLLIYFINDKYQCPTIILKEEVGESIILNDYLTKNSEIIEVKSESFTLSTENHTESFLAKVFKIFYPNNQKSRIALTAHNRGVTDVLLHSYIPEFEDDFYEEKDGKKGIILLKPMCLEII